MARFIVTSGAKFTPFTYEELNRPVAESAQAHAAMQDIYDQLSLETNALGQYISDNPGDSDAKKMYDTYMSNLEKLQEGLWQNGVSPQTRRDLSAARAGFARDITRLSTAIKARQDRSKAYWDTRHGHPDMIMGKDPGVGGLNDYLRDDTYGQDYYSYSGDSFMKEVGADAQARAGEMLGMPEYINNPQVAGYLMKISNEGYTSTEVNGAVTAVRNALASNDRSQIDSLPLGEKILANVLLSHVDSTGAQGKVDEGEFDRLINYGQAGLSQAIGKTTVQDLKDPAYEPQEDVTVGASDGAVPDNGKRGYTIHSLAQSLVSSGYEKKAKDLKGVYKKYENGSIMLTNPDGTATEVFSPYQMARIVFNSDARKDARRTFDGLDIANLKKGQTVTRMDKDGQPHTFTIDKRDGKFVLKQKDGVVNEAGTKLLNDYIVQHNKHIQSYRDANKDINLDRYAVSVEDEAKDREERGWDPHIDSDDYEALSMTSMFVGDATPATLLDTSPSMDVLRTALGRAMINNFKVAASNSGGRVGKGDRFALYEVGAGGMRTSAKGNVDIGSVFGQKKDGSITTDNALSSVNFFPENIAKGVGNGRPTVRFITNASDKQWETDAAALGTSFYNALKGASLPYSWSKEMQDYLGVHIPGGTAGQWSNADAVYYMMEPILNPSEALMMSDEQQVLWAEIAYTLLNGDDEVGSVQGPLIGLPDGGFRLATPVDIVRSPGLQNQLRTAVTQYINDVISVPRDELLQQHIQSLGNTSSHPQPFLP